MKRTKTSFRVQWGVSGASIARNYDATSWHELFTSSARFTPSSVRQPNGPKCTQIVRNAPKRQFRVQWGGLGAFVQKISTRLRGTNFCTTSARFAPSFVSQPNGHECTQIVQNTPKRKFRVKWGGLGAFVAKSSGATSWHKLLH